MSIIGKDIKQAATLLKSGNCVGIPTETVYGLAGNALDTAVVASIFRIKDRPDFDPLIVHVASLAQAQQYTLDWPEGAKSLAAKYWPGPLTLVLPKAVAIPFQVTSGLETVAIRVPDHALTLDLLQTLDFPLAAPSANPFGYVSPTTAAHVNDQLGGKISYILDGGPCRVGVESTIIAWNEGVPEILRLGAVTIEMIETVLGKVRVKTHSSSNPKAPGMLENHYAPHTKLVFQGAEKDVPGKTGYLGFDTFHPLYPRENQQLLSPSGDLFEAARNLYAMLRILDQQGLEKIILAPVPADGVGQAINDRIRRAVSK